MTDALPTYEIAVRPRGERACVRVLELRGDQTLHDVHRAILGAFGLDEGRAFTFYLSGELDDPESAYTGSPAGPTTRWPARLDGLDLAVGMPIAYVYDRGTVRHFELEPRAIGAADPRQSYPRLVAAEGALAPEPTWEEMCAPLPTPPESATPPEELCAAFAARFGPWFFGEAPTHDLDADGALALRLVEACPDLDHIARLGMVTDSDPVAWLESVAHALVRDGRFDEAVAIRRGLLAAIGLLVDRVGLARTLAAAGRGREALGVLDEATVSRPLDADLVAVTRSQVLASLGEHAEAERIARALLSRRWLGGTVRQRAVALLEQLLLASGREDEARRLSAAEAQRRRERTEPAAPERQSGPRAARRGRVPRKRRARRRT